MSSTSLYFLSRDLTEQFFQPFFDRLDNTYTGFTRSTAVIRSGSSVVSQMTIARRLEAVCAISHIFFKTMNWRYAPGYHPRRKFSQQAFLEIEGHFET